MSEQQNSEPRDPFEPTEDEKEIHRLRGEFLATVASIEYWTSLLTVVLIEPGKYSHEFDRWFLGASIPIRDRLRLFETVFATWEEDVNLKGLIKELREIHRFRNLLAHSFGWLGGSHQTSRGKEIPPDTFSIPAIRQRLKDARRVNSHLSSCWDAIVVGPPEITWQEWLEGDF